jgi:hypothetical protein
MPFNGPIKLLLAQAKTLMEFMMKAEGLEHMLR